MVRNVFKGRYKGGDQQASGQVTPMMDDAVYSPPVVTAEEEEVAAAAAEVLHHCKPAADDVLDVLKSYKRRWFVLFVVGMLCASSSMSWIGYAPVANFVDTYYGKRTSNYLSFSFVLFSIPVGFVAMWSAGKFGLRLAVCAASWMNFAGALIRIASGVRGLDESGRFALIVLGQCVSACAYPFIMFMPTKVAADWFPSDQRTTANVIANLCNPIGILIANFVSPRLVVEVSNIMLLHVALLVPATVVCLLATFGVRSSRPPVPPSHSAAVRSMDFAVGLRRAFSSKAYMTLALALGTGIGVFNTLYTIMQQLLCARGYSNAFAGLCCVSMNVAGLFGSMLVGNFVDRTKLFVETVKVVFCLAVISGIAFAVISLQYAMPAAVIASAIAFGFFGIASYPLGFEMGVECLFPVSESTTAGLTAMFGQLGTITFLPLVQFLSEPMKGAGLRRQLCMSSSELHVPVYDMTVSMMVLVSMCTLVACLFVVAFRPKYRRMKVDRLTTNGTLSEGILEIKTIVAS